MIEAIIRAEPMGDGIGFIELIDFMGSDLTIVNAARVSYSKRSEVMDLKAMKLIDYLMRNEHGSPFEHVVFQFRVRAPLYVVQQWERHRIASYNEESGRYIELRGDFAVPLGAMQFNPDDEEFYRDSYHRALFDYNELLRRGHAKEDARAVLPLGLYKEFYVTMNARALMNFLHLRNDAHAQADIRAYAAAMEQMFTSTLAITSESFNRHNRRVP
jgi:thymidylate synthase (FAD)